jgi:hypothetical protein
MHSQQATSATQHALDALMRKYPPRPLAITSTEATTDPLPNSHAVQDTTLPDAPTTTVPAEKDGWKTVEGKAAQKKRRNEKADNKWAATTANNIPKMTNGGRGKNTHQPRMNTSSAKKTWAEVVKCQDPYFHTLTNGRQCNVFSDTALQFGFGSRTKASS